MRSLSVLLLVLAVGAPPGDADAQTTIPGGVINGTWELDDSPFLVAGDITIPNGATLTIQAGVEVRVATSDAAMSGVNTGRVEITVASGGQLVTEGTAIEPVLLGSTGSSPASWIGVRFLAGSSGSLEGTIVEEASDGLYFEATPSVLDGLTLRTNQQGARVTGTASPTFTNSLFVENGVGALVGTSSGTTTLDHCTVDANSYGVQASTGTTLVRGSIVTNSAIYGLYRVSGATLTVERSNVWGNDVADYQPSTIPRDGASFSANPLFVSSANRRLTSRSPSRFSAAGSTDQGALPYGSDATPGFHGTYWTDTTLPASSSAVAGDLTVAPGVTVTLPAGATLVFATSDVMRAYANVGRSELRVLGTLATEGTAAEPVTVGSTGSSAASWIGVRFLAGSSGSLEGTIVEEASDGLYFEATPSVLDGLTLRTNQQGARVTGTASPTFTNSLFVENGVGALVGTSSGTTTLDHCTVDANSYGVQASTGTTLVRGSIVTNSAIYGLYRVSGATLTVERSNVWGNDVADYQPSSIPRDGATLSINPFYASSLDRHLTMTSPCIDAAGDGGPPRDFDGTLRPLDGNGFGGAQYDMGAYEYALVTECGDDIVGAGEACDDGDDNGEYGACNADCSGPGPRCGDGVTNGLEECDDANGEETDACLSSCLEASCGDGFVHDGVEQCDDMDAIETDECVECALAICGDGHVQVGVEDCDDMNVATTDTCVSCEAARCGDTYVQAGAEECDDGNGSDTDACTNACEDARCGDGNVGPGEQCDDGNGVDDDACSNECRDADCGDGVVQSGEECDDGNGVNEDTCTNACREPICGDGIVRAGEQCDDGNAVDDDTCSNACESARCGDGILHVGEECDDGNTVGSDACTASCRMARCGDGVLRSGMEACDDGNELNDDGCVESCVVAACGDGFVREGVEACDDGNTDPDDDCSPLCALLTCGDGTVQVGEECDDGNASNLDGCLSTCFTGHCGDGYVRAGTEACDDGNELDSDACLSSCHHASCGDGFVWDGEEECDDANAAQTDACLLSCEGARCGDGFVEDGVEECDDGNDAASDGCSPSCFEDEAPLLDGGVPTADAGTIDDGGGIAPDVDAGSGTETDGGCGCRATAPRSGLGGWLVALVALFARRRSARRRAG